MRHAWSLVTLALIGVCLSGCGGGSTQPTQSSPSRDPVQGGGDGRPGGAAWTLEFDRLAYPDRPASGKVHGQDFVPDRVQLDGTGLTCLIGPRSRAVSGGR